MFPAEQPPPKYLAYIEWFSKFTDPIANHGLYKISRSLDRGERVSEIIPLANIRRSIHLIPEFGPIAPRTWTSSNVLELCNTFFVNSFSDRHAYNTIF